MRYTITAGPGCSGGTCPTVYADSQREGEVLVQGYIVAAEEAGTLGIPAGEAVVRVPLALLREAVDG